MLTCAVVSFYKTNTLQQNIFHLNSCYLADKTYVHLLFHIDSTKTSDDFPEFSSEPSSVSKYIIRNKGWPPSTCEWYNSIDFLLLTMSNTFCSFKRTEHVHSDIMWPTSHLTNWLPRNLLHKRYRSVKSDSLYLIKFYTFKEIFQRISIYYKFCQFLKRGVRTETFAVFSLL